MKFHELASYRRKYRISTVDGGVAVGGPIQNPALPSLPPFTYCVDVVLSKYATGINKWSVAVSDNTLRHFTLERLPDCIKDAVTLIAPYADEKGYRREIGVSGSVTFPKDEWPEEFKEIGWYTGKAIWYPHRDFDSPVEEHLFMVVVNEAQLAGLRARIDDLSLV